MYCRFFTPKSMKYIKHTVGGVKLRRKVLYVVQKMKNAFFQKRTVNSGYFENWKSHFFYRTRMSMQNTKNWIHCFSFYAQGLYFLPLFYKILCKNKLSVFEKTHCSFSAQHKAFSGVISPPPPTVVLVIWYSL